MIKQKIRSKVLVLLDIFLLSLSLFSAYLIRFDLDLLTVKKYLIPSIIYISVASIVLKLIVFKLLKLYESLWRYAGVYELVSISLASFIANGVIFTYNYFTILSPRSIFIITFLIDIFVIGGSRFAYRIYRRMIKGEYYKMKPLKSILIVGAGDEGAIINKNIKMHPELKSKVVAFIDNDEQKIGKKLNGTPIVGGDEDIENAVLEYNVDEIIIALPSADSKKINEIYSECAKTSCKVKILPSLPELLDEKVVIQKLRDVKIDDLLGREPINLNDDFIGSYINNKVVLITGGGGSIGSELCRQVSAYNPKKLIILDNYENNVYDIQNELMYMFPELSLNVVIANIREKDRMDSVFNQYKPNVVFHAAAHKHVPLMEDNPEEAVKNNIFGTFNVAECASIHNAERFVMISTDKAVNPTNIMGATKKTAEMIVQAFDKISNTEYVAVRFGNVLGSNGSVIPLFKKQIEKGGPLTVTHPMITRYFMTIPEAVQLVLRSSAMAKGGEIFVLDMGEPIKILDLAKNLIKLSGYNYEEEIKIEFTGLRPGEKLYEELLLKEEGLLKTKDDKIYIAKPIHVDFSHIKRELDYLKEIIESKSEDIINYMQILVPTYKRAQ